MKEVDGKEVTYVKNERIISVAECNGIWCDNHLCLFKHLYIIDQSLELTLSIQSGICCGISKLY